MRPTTLAEALRMQRARLTMTTDAAAAVFGVHANTWRKWEAGTMPSSRECPALREWLDIEAGAFLALLHGAEVSA